MGKLSSELRWMARQCTETFSWAGVAWFVALGLGLWGAMVGIGAFKPSLIVLTLCAILCALKWAYVTEIDLERRRVAAFIFGLIILFSATAGVGLLTRSMESSAAEEANRVASLQQIPDLQAKLNEMNQSNRELRRQVDTFAPKLDIMVNQLGSAEQKALALALREQWMPKIEPDEPSLSGVNSFDFQLFTGMENTGGSIAREVVATSDMVIAVKSKESEDALFRYIHEHAHDADVKPLDMDPGYGSRANIVIASHPAEMRLDMIRRMRRDEVVYIGVLVTFVDSEGGQHYTERCYFFDNDSTHVDHTCDGHNESD